MNPGEAEQLMRLTNTIIQQVETMKEMVNTFSEYARPPVMALEYLDLNQLIQEVIDLYGNLDANASIKMELAPDLPRIKADPGRLRRVFNNLITNAFDASAANKQTILTIKTNYVSEKGLDFIEVRIRDSGPGISEDIITTVFEPYVTNKQKGTGLGLAIVKKIIEEHGGVVWLENNAGGPGACAVIRLPVATAANMKTTDSYSQKGVL